MHQRKGVNLYHIERPRIGCKMQNPTKNDYTTRFIWTVIDDVMTAMK
jgi:hypothetical protein